MEREKQDVTSGKDSLPLDLESLHIKMLKDLLEDYFKTHRKIS